MMNTEYERIVEAIKQEPVDIPNMPSNDLKRWIDGYFSAEARIIKTILNVAEKGRVLNEK